MSLHLPPEYSDYHDLLSSVLIDFQFIEEMLRMNISSCYEIIDRALNGSIPFRYTYNDLEKDALGTLVSKFEKFSTDVDLIKELKDLIQHRNGAAHKGWLLSSEQQNNVNYLNSLMAELTGVKERTRNVFHVLVEAGNYLDEKKNPNKAN